MHTIYPKRTPLASFYVRPLNRTLKFILLCCNVANPFEAIAKVTGCTSTKLHTHFFYLFSHGLLMPMTLEKQIVA